MKENGVPASVSYTAGTFVCNHLMYGTLNHIHKSFSHIRGGFIHVPYIPEQVSSRNDTMPSMSIGMIVLGLELAITATVENHEDIKISNGTLH
jgi:pyroglutamyl-peptidase